MAEETLPWVHLLTLLVHGRDSTMRGVIRHLHSAGPGYAWVGHRPVVAGGLSGGDSTFQAWKDGRRYRQETAGGAATLIVGDDFCWSWGDDELPVRQPADHVKFLGAGSGLVRRREPRDWLDGDDFTEPTGPATATTYLGRAAWAVEIAPPPRKLSPMQLVVDAETGLILQQRNDAQGLVEEWVELELGETLDPALFTWDGPFVDGGELEQLRHETRQVAEAARGAAFARDVVPVPLRFEVQVGVCVRFYDPDSGEFEVSLGGDFSSVGDLVRRRRASEPWEDRSEADHTWSDESWDWALTCQDVDITPAGLEQLQAQLGSTPR